MLFTLAKYFLQIPSFIFSLVRVSVLAGYPKPSKFFSLIIAILRKHFLCSPPASLTALFKRHCFFILALDF